LSFDVMAVVLFAATLHAGWNALVRASSQQFHDVVLLVLGVAAWAVVLMPLLPVPRAESWPYLIASAFIHVAYFSLVAFAYRSGELSFAYPVMRGVAPALSAIGAALIIGESPSSGGWAGVLLISFGVLMLAGDSWRAGTLRPAPAIYALTNAAVIAVFTLVDGQGVRLSGSAFSYTGWMFLLTAPMLLAVSVAAGQGAHLVHRLRVSWRRALLGSACTLTSYALALWAMTHAPIALVAALRETSVIFATAIAVFVLKEPVTRLRYASVLTVTAGAVAMKAF
jgi:drug/metabolite transporter (DMT)-like permease